MNRKQTDWSYSKPVKAVAVALGAVFFCLSAIYGTRVVLYLSNYDNSVTDSLRAGESDVFRQFTESNRFGRELSSALSSLGDYITTFRSEAAVRDGSAFHAIQEEIEQQRDEVIHRLVEEGRAREQKVKADGRGYETSGPPTQPGTQAASNPADSTGSTQMEPESSYHMSSDYDGTRVISYNGYQLYFLKDGSFDEEATRQAVTKDFDERIRAAKMTFDARYRAVLNQMQAIQSLKYIILDRQTNQVYTNWEETISSRDDIVSRIREKKEAAPDGSFWYALYSRTDNLFEQSGTQSMYWDDYLFQIIDGKSIAANYDIYLFMDPPTGYTDTFAILYQNYLSVHEHFFAMMVTTVMGLVGLAAVAVFSVCKAGRRTRGGTVALLWSDRPYNDLHLLYSAALTILAGCGAVALTLLYSEPEYVMSLSNSAVMLCRFGAVLCGLLGGAFLLEWLLSVARHVKMHDFWRHTLLYRILYRGGKLLLRGGKRLLRWLFTPVRRLIDLIKNARLHHTLRNVRQTALLAVIGYVAGNLVLAILLGISMLSVTPLFSLMMAMALLLYNVLILIFLWRTLVSLDEIMLAVENAQHGDFDYPLDPSRMPNFLRKFAADIVEMQHGVKAAVAEAVKGERMKTELITNVSHDLKTPLTSVINYVDLLKRCEMPDESARRYLDVLTEKSARLKRLIEDLTEASKASTGNIELHPVHVNLYELAMQAVGEYEDDLTGQGIELRLNVPKTQPIILADSQKMWRVIDNLVSNVKKYSLAGTRAYLNVTQEDGYGVVSIKNISRAALDIPPEQLTQRFVRGDAARTTEGSGLGLSIAQSFVELMGGRFDITIDGDLFKVTVAIPLAPPAPGSGSSVPQQEQPPAPGSGSSVPQQEQPPAVSPQPPAAPQGQAPAQPEE